MSLCDTLRLLVEGRSSTIISAIAGRSMISEKFTSKTFPRTRITLLEGSDGIDVTFLRVKRETDQFIVKEEEWKLPHDEESSKVSMLSVYSKTDGSYMGMEDKWLVKMVEKHNITQIQSRNGGHVACIGYCENYVEDGTKNNPRQVWIGWSHRAACPFGIGDKIFDASLLGSLSDEDNEWSDVPFPQVGLEDIKSLDDAKTAAINFAEYVS